MCDIENSIRITQTCSTIASLLDVSAPAAADEPISTVLKAAGGPVERVLCYNPDAIALWLYQKHTALFEDVMLSSQLTLPVRSVMPSVTPVCFASMYSGVTPDVHGIKRYVKPVLTVETLFDALIAAGKKPAIVSTTGDSISMIFLERKMDYFFYETPDECNAKALELLEKDEYDLIVVYNGNYDGTMHKHGTEAEPSIDALRHNVAAFKMLSEAAAKCWAGRKYVTAFLPDHGCHDIDGDCGGHGLDMPEDMNIVHFYNVSR